MWFLCGSVSSFSSSHHFSRSLSHARFLLYRVVALSLATAVLHYASATERFENHFLLVCSHSLSLSLLCGLLFQNIDLSGLDSRDSLVDDLQRISVTASHE